MSLGPKQMEEAIFRNLPKNTGKTLDEWIKILIKSYVKGIKEQIAWLKTQGLGTVQATFIVHKHNKVENIYEDGDKLIDDLFSDVNKKFRKDYDTLVSKIRKLGSDVSVRPCKTYIPLYRNKQFVTIKPTKQGLAIGLALKVKQKHKRLQPPAKNIGSERINQMIVIS
jgi:predicted transport protein